ncbi:sulfonate ABC transporter substrate-binding protein [Pararobbsia silviterrae]|uniref:Putative aliphatic sulfonates-binding protein n=1 Tax=Pararobbsia silviterrae TaxID=1792498 RepID=A0A494X9E8_9BURK|nr:sulfonate ABC transporter substrate-binding protein [Pararobbsia silviterrae]RKP44263.1 sulfonate ABC transporter substrate-binding protein [Pararobbsia silviterrae]
MTDPRNPINTSKRALLRASAAAALGATLGFGGPLKAAAQGSKVVRIGYQKYGTLVIVKSRGTLEKRLAAIGATVQWLEFPAGPQLLEGLNAGAVDIGTVGETPPIFAQAGGVDFVYVGNEPPAPAAEAIVIPKNSSIRSVADLRGKKVALNRGSNVHYLLVRALASAKLRYEDIQPVYLAPADARAAFEQNNVDAWAIWDPYFASIQHAGAKVLVDGTGLVRNLQFYVAARAFTERAPELVHAVIDELRDTDAWGKAHPSEVTRVLAPNTGLDQPVVDLAVGRYSFGVQPISDEIVAYQQNIADTFTELKLIPRKLDVKQVRWKA